MNLLISSWDDIVPQKDISAQGLQVIVASNPRNPTGQVVQGEDLKDLVRLCDNHCTVVLDEVCSAKYPIENNVFDCGFP
jgi:aspartate/methionine/tyrosine aminotransferase